MGNKETFAPEEVVDVPVVEQALVVALHLPHFPPPPSDLPLQVQPPPDGATLPGVGSSNKRRRYSLHLTASRRAVRGGCQPHHLRKDHFFTNAL